MPKLAERYRLLKSIAIALLGACCSPATVDAGPPAGYKLAWNDEFDTLSLGTKGSGARWLPYFAGWNVRHLAGNNDQAIKMADFEPTANGRKAGDVLRQAGVAPLPSTYLHEAKGGALALRAYRLPAGLRPQFWNFPYVAGMISSEGSYAQRYGYWEVRLRLENVGRGTHFAVWLLPTDGRWPPEIDLLEVVGQHPNTVFVNAHGESPDRPISQKQVANLAQSWTTVGFLRTPTTMRWTVNGMMVREHNNYTQKDLYLLMSWEVGTHWAGATSTSTVWPGQVSIDYVRIYRPPA